MEEQADEDKERAYLSAKLKHTLELDGDPVAISILPDAPQGSKSQRKVTLCMLIQSARRGQSVCCTGKNIICNGKVHIGIGYPPSWDIEDFLVRREKIVGSKTAARKLIDLATMQLSGSGKHIVLSPLADTNCHPDVVVFVGTPLQVSRLLYLDAFETGEIKTIHREPLCSGVIAAPIVTGQIGISFLDMSCRYLGKYRPEEMAIGIPYHRLSKIADNIDHSIAGTAKSSFLVRLLPKIIHPDR